MAHLIPAQKSVILEQARLPRRNVAAIGRQVGCSRQTVYNQLNKRWPSTGEPAAFLVENKRRRKNKYTAQQELDVLSFFDLYPFATFSDGLAVLKLDLSVDTLSRILARNGIKTYVSKRKPFMNLIHQGKRLVVKTYRYS